MKLPKKKLLHAKDSVRGLLVLPSTILVSGLLAITASLQAQAVQFPVESKMNHTLGYAKGSGLSCQASLELSLENAEALNVAENELVYFTMNAWRSNDIERTEVQLASLELNAEQDGFIARSHGLQIYQSGISCRLSNVSVGSYKKDIVIVDTSSSGSGRVKVVEIDEGGLHSAKLAALIEPFVQTLEIMQLSQLSGQEDQVERVLERLNSSGLYEPWFVRDDFLEFAETVANTVISSERYSQNQMGFIPEFYGQQSDEIARVLEDELASFANSYLGIDLSGQGEVLRMALMKRLNQSHYGIYGSASQLRATFVLQSAPELNRENAHLLNSEQFEMSFAVMQAAYETDGLGGSPLESVALMYVSLVKGDWVSVDGEHDLSFIETVLAGSQYGIDVDKLFLTHAGGQSLAGMFSYQMAREIFANVETISGEDGDREQLQTIAVQLALDSILLDSSYAYGSIDQVKSTVAKRLFSTLPEGRFDASGLGLADWTAVYDYLYQEYVNSSDEEYVTFIAGRITMHKYLAHLRTGVAEVRLSKRKWMRLGSPRSATLQYTYRHYTKQVTVNATNVNGQVHFIADDRVRYNLGWQFNFNRVRFDNGATFTSGNLADESSNNGGIDGYLTRNKPNQDGVSYSNPQTLAARMFVDIGGIEARDSEVGDIFRFFEQAVGPINDVENMIALIGGSDNSESDVYQLMVTREAVAKAQLALYGASQAVIDQYWRSYVGVGSISSMLSSDNRGLIPNDVILALRPLETAERAWFAATGNSQLYSITNYWQDKFASNMRLLARSYAYQLGLKLLQQGRISVNELLTPKVDFYVRMMTLAIQNTASNPRTVSAYRHTQRFDANWLLTHNDSDLPEVKISTDFLSDFDFSNRITSMNNLGINIGAQHYRELGADNCADEEVSRRGRYRCEMHYYTRDGVSYLEAVEAAIYTAMMSRRESYKSFTTGNEIFLEVVKGFVPLWGTVESFKEGDHLNGTIGLVTDVVSFIPVGTAGIKAASSVSKTVQVVKTSAQVASVASKLSRGAYLVQRFNKPILALQRLTHGAKAARAARVTRAMSRALLLELNPASGLDDLAQSAVLAGRRLSGALQRRLSTSAKSINKAALNVEPHKFVIRADVHADLGLDASTTVRRPSHGMPLEHQAEFADYADQENLIIAVRPVADIATSLLESGEYATKSLKIKAKSSDWGPMAGFIPADQSFAKAGVRNSPERIAKYNQAAQDSIPGDAIAKQLEISSARLVELRSKSVVSINGTDSDTLVQVATPEGINFELSRVDSGDTWKVSSVDAESGEVVPLEVLAGPQSGREMIADYDLMAVLHGYDSHGAVDNFQIQKPWQEFRADMEKYSTIPVEFETLYESQSAYYGLLDNELGVISARVREVKNSLNARMNRINGYEVVHHGADEANPFAELGDNFPAIFFTPKWLDTSNFAKTTDGFVIISNKQELLGFYQQALNNKFVAYRNSRWGQEFVDLRPDWFRAARSVYE